MLLSSSWFANLYVASAAIAGLAVLLRMRFRLSQGRLLLSNALVVPLVVIYLIGMHRAAGTDFEVYLAAYLGQSADPIPDIGYTALTWLTRQLGIDFSNFQLLQGLFTLVVVWLAAKHYRADPVVVIVFYLLHLAIVRDLSQSRIGLAVAVYLLGQISVRPSVRSLLYLAAASIHITVVVLIFIWAYANFTRRLKQFDQWLLLYVPLAVFAAYGMVVLDLASSLDPRIAYYMSWDEEGYGAPLTSFNSLWRSGLVLGIYLLVTARRNEAGLRSFAVMELAGAAILIGFSDFSIFAARFSNVLFSMYPIGLGIAVRACRSNYAARPSAIRSIGLKVTVGLTLIVLLLRPGSFDTLREVVPITFISLVD